MHLFHDALVSFAERRVISMKIKEKLMHKYALSPQGASDMLKAFVSVTVSDLVLMIPVSLLYFIVKDYMEGTLQGKGGFYIAGIIVTLALIAITTYIQYNATFLSTYVESGVRRITLAEKLRKIPLSFFGKKDLSDLTSTIMADCAQMETASSHFIPELVGACISTAFVAIGLFFFDWRMAIAALWVLPISFIIVSCSGKVQRKLNEKQVALKMTCADGIQECLESVRDIRAYNTQEEYMKGLDEKIKAVEKHAVATELGTAVFCWKCTDDSQAWYCNSCFGRRSIISQWKVRCYHIFHVSYGCIKNI